MRRAACGITGIVYFLFTVLFLVRASAEEPKRDALTAKDVLDRMAKTYAECKSYRDTGMVETKARRVVFFGQPTTFSTVFVRPKRFRFEYTQNQMAPPGVESQLHEILWCNGNEVRLWSSALPGIKKEESLGMAVDWATGLSSGSAHTIPSLLLPKEIGGRRLTDITEAKRIEDAHIGNVACIRISGKYGDSAMTLWLDQKQFLVRRIDSQSKIEERTTTYEPVIDEKIAEKLLKFNPPRGENVAAGDEDLAALQKERVETLTRLVKVNTLQYKEGLVSGEAFAGAETALVNAQLGAADKPDAVVTILEAALKREDNAHEVAGACK